MRVTKAPEVRRAEILATAAQIFQQKGYATSSVDEIVQALGVAKGTFYHYFKSKEEILFELARRTAEQMQEEAWLIAKKPSLSAIEKLCAVLHAQHKVADEQEHIVDSMHLPANRALHEQINVETVLMLGEVFAYIVEQGNQEGVFQVTYSLATTQFILAGSLFLFGEGVFPWTPEEKAERQIAMITLIERGLGAEPGSLASKLGANLR